jgi:UDP-N-acetylglucosamine 2-epimerase
MRVALVIGTRPQIIKSAPIIKEAGRRGLELDVIHTGQHYDYEMSKVFFNELGLPDPVVNLGVGSGSHAFQTGRMLVELERVYGELDPDVVVVPGDTNSTLAGALAAAKMGIPVGHVEAGARSFDMGMPEEVNRRLTDHCSDTLFAVSEWCRDQLLREGIGSEKVHLVGDTMYESIQNSRSSFELTCTSEMGETRSPSILTIIVVIEHQRQTGLLSLIIQLPISGYQARRRGLGEREIA